MKLIALLTLRKSIFHKVKSSLITATFLGLLFFTNSAIIAQVDTGGNADTSNHDKQVIGYITNWDAWKSSSAGVPSAGALTQLNIDYSKYTILNYSFFGVAQDGSLHSGDLRNKNINQAGAVQQPGDLLYGDVYSSWDFHILFGEIDPVNWINEGVKQRAETLGFEVEVGGSTWSHPDWGLSGVLPLPLPKEGTDAKGLLELAHQNGVKVMASLGGWSMCKHFPEMASDPVKRARFIEDCKKLMNMGFDGIDLDWEYPGPFSGMNFTGTVADYGNFSTLVSEIRAAIGPNKLITAAMSADPKKIEGFDWPELVSTMDYFNMMTYDFNGGWSNKAGHNAPVYPYDGAEAPDFNWQSTYNKLMMLGVPANKVNMGIPFYGRGVLTDGAAALNAPTVKRNITVQPDGLVSTASDYTNWPLDVYDGTPNYFFIKQKTGEGSGWTRQWDDQAKVPYMTKDNFFLSYDDEESIAIKAQYINDNNLGGTIVWTVFGDVEISGAVESFGPKLKRWSNVKSPLINTVNEVFAGNGTNNANPIVSIVSPTTEDSFEEGASIVVTAQATDSDGTITRVEFYNGTTLLGSDNTAPYTYNWSDVPAGDYVITAKAYDNENANSSASVSISVLGDLQNELPIVTITSPKDGDSFQVGSIISILVDAYDNGGSISTIEFYDGDTLLAEDTSTPYSYDWVDVSVGSHLINVKAIDNENGVSYSSITITVLDENSCTTASYLDDQVYRGGDRVSYQGKEYEAKWWTQSNDPITNRDSVWKLIGPCSDDDVQITPEVAIVNPLEGQSFIEGEMITINATASDSDGDITKVEFYIDGVLLYDDASMPYETSWESIEGTHVIKAIATDNDGLVKVSEEITFIVRLKTTGECNEAQYTENGGYSAGSTVQNSGNVYECRAWPNSGWCNGASWAYEPGTGEYWQDAWKLVGECNGDSSDDNQLPTSVITQPVSGQSFTIGSTIIIRANAADSDGSIAKVEFLSNGVKIGEDISSPYRLSWNNVPSGNYNLTVRAIDNENAEKFSDEVSISVGNVEPPRGDELPKRILVGYWHNFNNGSTTPRLIDVSTKWDVICIAFAEPKYGSRSDMAFSPYEIYGNNQEFINDVAAVRARGQKVLISIGGANALVELNTAVEKNEFVTSMTSIIKTYGFDGLDIDLEGSSLSLDSGDTDFRNPSTPKIVNLISATKSIRNNVGAGDFILSMAPETLYVQGGFSGYGGASGAYLPVIYGLLDEMNYIHVQHYNTGCMLGLDGVCYSSANADFHVAMADMLLQGFPAGGNQFPALRPDQVAIGLPANTSAAGSGYTTPEEVHKALDYIIKGESFGGRYTLRNPSGYPSFRGIMTWSINWDIASGFNFSDPHRAYLDGLDVRAPQLSSVGRIVNPFDDDVNVKLTLRKASYVSAYLYNQIGKKVAVIKDYEFIDTGDFNLSWVANEIPSGLYFLKIRIGKKVETIKLIKQ